MYRVIFTLLSVMAICNLSYSQSGSQNNLAFAEHTSTERLADRAVNPLTKKHSNKTLVKNTFYLDLSKKKTACMVTITNADKEVLFEQEMSAHKIPLYLGNWKPGRYTLFVDGKKYTKLLLKTEYADRF